MFKLLYILLVVALLTISCQNINEEKTEFKKDVALNDSMLICDDSIKNSAPVLIYFKQSDCKINCKLEEKILNQYYTHDTLNIKIASIQDCGVKYTVEIDTFKNETLNFKITNNTGISQECYCVNLY
ncbi:MAG: hypothetical protein GW876_11340 [Bacteroidetes bacterium]|nr:hypothetical protein [Bacteroidota bacterium]PIX36614.1 MAG: hypothetical protein COZ59_00135 [Bacteroidetes bacterium CG_4_8_14_3_um_filter_31_14]